MTRNPSSLILALVAAFFIIVGFGGCNDTREAGKDPVQVEKDKQVAQVSANLKPIGTSLSATGRPAEGAAVTSQTAVLDGVVDLDPKDMPAPVATLEEWLALKNDAAAKAEMAARFKAAAEQATGELAAVKAANNGWWAWLRDGSALAGTMAAAAAVYRGMGGPGSGLIDLAVKAAFPKGFQALKGNVDALARKNEVLVTAVASSDVAREALASLDQHIGTLPPAVGDALGGVIAAATGGKADSLEGYFKTFAKAHAVDEGKAREIDGVLNEIRNTVDTTGGRSDAFASIAQALAGAVLARPGKPVG